MKPIDLIDKTKVYQFIKSTESRNTIDKLCRQEDQESLKNLLKSIERWMRWHDAQNVKCMKCRRSSINICIKICKKHSWVALLKLPITLVI